MYTYNTTEWFLFFYLYCFIGWVWESCYVSVKKRKWVNRGFMHGPFLPIYGFGAIVVLLFTIPVKSNIFLVFLFGMIGATILEYCTGTCMEKLFHVRYWDYSNQPLNLNGHICLGVSLAWGGFSILLIRCIHAPIEKLILGIPATAADILAFALTIVVVVDFTESFNEAMDLKTTLVKLSESNKQIQKIQKRLDAIVMTAEEDYRDYREKKEIKDEINKKRKLSKKEAFQSNLEKIRQKRENQLQELSLKINNYLKSKDAETEEAKLFIEQIKREEKNMQARTDKQYLRSVRLLRRNPGSVSKKYMEALREIQKLTEEK